MPPPSHSAFSGDGGGAMSLRSSVLVMPSLTLILADVFGTDLFVIRGAEVLHSFTIIETSLAVGWVSVPRVMFNGRCLIVPA